MAFFSAVSSSIGKKLLLYGLRHIDILDKDPADFVSVDVGKRTTLEVRDVGLHIKVCMERRTRRSARLTLRHQKLVALLHLKLPPEIHLSSAKASLLRVTFVLDFGVPQISIEVDGIQVKAELLEDAEDVTAGQDTHPRQRAPSSPTRDRQHDTTLHPDEHVPTVDDLAQSFIREEPAEEIRELAQELESQPRHMQESLSASDDSEEEGSAGVGAPLGLPAYLRNILNTALDRLSVVVNDINVEMEDQNSVEPTSPSKSGESSPVSLDFHIARIGIDSVTSEEPHINISPAAQPHDAASRVGKRRLRIENVCARLVSDAENFISQSLRPLSPETTRSEASTEHRSYREQTPSAVQSPPAREAPLPRTEPTQPVRVAEPTFAVEESIEQLKSEPVTPLATSMQEETPSASPYPQETPLIPSIHEELPLAQSVATVDDDRFADASSDDGLEHARQQEDLHRSGDVYLASGLGGSSILYDDENVLDYALQHDMLDSTFDRHLEEAMRTDDARFEDHYDGSPDASSHNLSTHASGASSSLLPTVSGLGMSFAQPNAAFSPPASEASTSAFPTVSGLGVSFTQSQQEPDPTASQSLPQGSASLEHSLAMDREPMSQSVEDEPRMSTGSLHASESVIEAAPQMSRSISSSSSDASESMYMSAVSAAPVVSSQRHLPGGWDSSSSSSRGASSDTSGSVPEEMISGSILQPHPEVEDGYDTPRPSSRQSAVAAAPAITVAPSSMSHSNVVQKQAKVFLTIDEVTVWFPLGLDKGETSDADSSAEPAYDASTLNFAPSRLGEDSIFAEMPGSFSNYAHSTSSRRTGSMMESLRRPAQSRPTSSLPAKRPAKTSPSPNVIVDVGSVVGHVDLSTGRIMFNMLSRVLGALTDAPQPQKPSPSTEPVISAASSTLELTVRNFGIAWLDSVQIESMHDELTSARTLELKPNDALLSIHLAAIRLTSQSSAEKMRAKLQIEKLSIASLGIDILAFHTSRSRSRRSVSNLPDQLSHDLELDYEQGADKRVTIVTRPVKVNFDIQQLDDALSSFGGFSGVLELGNSISSHNALNSPVLTPARSKPRGVHFGDSPPVIETPATPSNMPKIQIQLGEVAFLLKGRSCAVQLQTTTVRIAVRQSNVRLKVSDVQLSGPYLDAKQKGAPLLVEVQGTTVNFLYNPEEADLTRLISLITPSKDPYENNEDILIDTFLRQRRKGSVLRVEVSSVGIRVSDLEEMRAFETLGAELARLSKVTKYLPEDDRPGLLTLASVQQLDVGLAVNEMLGDVSITAQNAAVAHVGFPALFAMEIGTASLKRQDEVLIHEVVKLRSQDQLPMIMVRMVGDELEPVVKAKLFNLCAEYRVSTFMAALGISEDGTVEDIAVGIASSVATITRSKSPQPITRQSSDASSPSSPTSKPLQIDLLLRNCAIGLNPRNLPSKGLFVFTDAHLNGKQAKKDYFVQLDLRKASIHAIDDVARLDEEHSETVPRSATATTRHLQELGRLGFVSLSSISAAKVLVNIAGDGKDTPQLVNVEFKNELLVLESCADSTQTLIEVLNGLQPPTPPSTAERYRTVVPLQEMMESFTGDAIPAQDEFGDDDFMNNADLMEDEVPTNLEFVGSIYSQGLLNNEDMGDSMLDQGGLGALAASLTIKDRGDQGLLESFQEQYEVNKGEDSFDFSTDYFQESDSEGKGKARKWDSKQNQYHLTNEFKAPDAPLKVTVRDVNVIWNLFDGYDWPRTRAIISQAVDDVEARAEERRRKPREEDDDDDFIEEDFLFNSVWIGVPIKEEKGALARKINHDIDDLVSETGSYATSTATQSTGATARPRSATKSSRRRLKLERSKHKKIAFSLMGIAVDLVVFPPDSGETLNSIDVRVQDFEIFDHVPTSTWKKFITCIIPPAQRELDRPMINLNLLTVKPVTDLAASELVIRVSSPCLPNTAC
jgi:autophagy-related protein 2